uniref:Kef-type K+ transport systems, predicted NAD-binding component n=1 Tax=uncultured marine group II/III euryarchaeote KM3_195_B08 TaxID=1457970 RepID=A0A075GRZ2_9EURY|nr:Kef-type K+ transport systems, predicted NAD-binding component [uncultured marine group II/III euryarchaeote KM3_195_B08]
MDSLKQNIFLSISLIILLYAVGFAVYSHLEGWSFIDSIYFQTMTFTTIGYGDIVPVTDEGKLFTVLISWIGISIAFFVLYTISAYRERVVDKKINTLIGRIPRMLPTRNNKKKK